MCLLFQQPHEWAVQFELAPNYPDEVICLGDDDTLGILAWIHVMFLAICSAMLSQCL